MLVEVLPSPPMGASITVVIKKAPSPGLPSRKIRPFGFSKTILE